ncbi:uncharacterized protein At4g19900 [Dendrobium catenatum]|uniref:uncharacterized protein At4g19900 n=1 Tax=Dendrobium catenatum TaxID=906689 RepID=UPI0009F1A52A|nr:uncharacterized protein At4g19900 [Dendrobium catenatum]XP_028554607.1 uncharacterized protein At4g19900 [Dendrobium catenatum]XP_028554608.1 uncharacterized protein At4g19900 [Dendrobium catenatum]XP_028554609.1 uncharacterized protein At4g19900 [Dendrobium catenatum]XP_028554610.1 uncharacterized protein At4g19900 [Dendrobium catenatum]XP_028554611.1 uncharacterized protein At4g19900 [Dendrobium catenatum]XP_028554612.1 uncharacterized protein At4g19900 [Dendrobium catenatum]XP_02855461
MHRQPSVRRRSSYAPQLCVAGAIVLLLLSLSILHMRLSSSPLVLSFPFHSSASNRSANSNFNTLFDDVANDDVDGGVDDRIDELDVLDDDKKLVITAADNDDSDSDDSELRSRSGSGLFWDHAFGVARISFGRTKSRSEPEEDSRREDQARSKLAFGSDDEPVDEDVRAKLASIRRIEDALLLKVDGHGGNSLMRDGWARWLEGKGDFIRRDRMLRSNLEMLNPKNHPLLQDPDVAGLTGLTRGDRLMQKAILKEMDKAGSIGSEMKRIEGRRTLHLKVEREKKEEGNVWRWGNFPGIDSKLGFSEFIDQFFVIGQCSLRVFMVWNSPSWSFGVRHQRGLESLLHHHRNACVLLFSETIELDFFKDFVKDGFRIAVVMPNLDELLKDTPAHVFASAWFEWRKTKYYPLHYSELVRLAALYKYGGVYLDSDLIVLKPLYSLRNSVCVDDQRGGDSTYSGAVMAFERHSPFVKECLTEFFSTYDDTLLTWNGANLLTRVIKRLQRKGDKYWEELRINLISTHSIFPISSMDITRYFAVASEEPERVYHEQLFRRILDESYTFHFWNGITSALVPELGSLTDKLLNEYCLRCLDIL